jgi:hypothetical protein
VVRPPIPRNEKWLLFVRLLADTQPMPVVDRRRSSQIDADDVAQ